MMMVTAGFGMGPWAQARALRAVRLGVLPSPPEYRVAVDPARMDIPCDQIVDRLMAYNQMAREHDLSVKSFLAEVSQKVGEWHAVLKPLENSAKRIPKGTFEPLAKGVEQIDLITNLAWDNTGLLAIELDNIILAMRA
ncbi:MAG: hypothetical protein AB7P49_17730 [Bdellovibrionales bacterium]